MQTTRQSPRFWWWAAVLLLVIFFISRIHNLLTLPLFLDESSHLTRAQWVWEGKPFYLLETGKALAPYLAALFWPFSAAPFIGRYVVVLLGALGLASAFAVGRELHSRHVGLLCMALWIICPQLMFFERMALVDTTMSSMAMLTLWFGIRMIRSGRIRMAILCGLGIALTVLAKLTGLVYLSIPVLVFLFITSKKRWRLRARQVVIAYVAAGVLLAGPGLYLLSIAADPTGLSSGLTTTDTSSLPERMQNNLQKVLGAEVTYFSETMLRLMAGVAIVALFLASRRTLLLLAMVAAPLLAITAAAATLWLRYASVLAPFLLMLTSLGLVLIAEGLRKTLRVPRLVYALPWLVPVIWALAVGLPFQLTAYGDPTQLPLTKGDRSEYITWIPSGYGIREAARYLQETFKTPEIVMGTAVNCNAARLYMPVDSPVKFVCFDLDWGGGNWDQVRAITKQAAESGHVYVLGEDVAIVREDQLPEVHTLIKTFNRPGQYYAVYLYRIDHLPEAARIH